MIEKKYLVDQQKKLDEFFSNSKDATILYKTHSEEEFENKEKDASDSYQEESKSLSPIEIWLFNKAV